MRPLARWTIGPVGQTGKEILRESVSLFRKAYPDFDVVVCHNHVDPGEFADLKVDLHEQSSDTVICNLREPDGNTDCASGCGWKLCPPRLRPDGHELWIDNDLIIRSRLPQIEEWLGRPHAGIISEGVGRQRMFSIYDRFIPDGIHACAGLFGLPPGFDFGKKICFYAQFLEWRTLGGFEEQGLTVATVVNMPEYIMIPIDVCYISEDHVPFPAKTPPAVHFVGANRKDWHRGWKSYKDRRDTVLMI